MATNVPKCAAIGAFASQTSSEKSKLFTAIHRLSKYSSDRSATTRKIPAAAAAAATECTHIFTTTTAAITSTIDQSNRFNKLIAFAEYSTTIQSPIANNQLGIFTSTENCIAGRSDDAQFGTAASTESQHHTRAAAIRSKTIYTE